MTRAAYPDDEERRLRSLRDLKILDTAPEPQFDALVRAAALVTGAPVALLSFVDSERQWFKSNQGLAGLTETTRDASFCAHAILQNELLEVPDTTRDLRFADNPLVTGGPRARFYAGAPVTLADGSRVGTLCVVDTAPRRLTLEQREALSQLALAAAQGLEGRRALLEDVTERLRVEHELMQEHQRLVHLIEGTRAGTWEWNVQTGATRFNSQWGEIIGLSLDELGPGSRQAWLDRIHPQDLQRLEPILNRHLAGASSGYECEVRLRHRDGHWVWVLSRGRVQTWTTDGKPECMFGVDIEIAALKQQEEVLRKHQTFLNRTGEIAGVGGWELNLGSGELVWSDQTCRIHGVELGYRPNLDEAIGFYAPDARPVIRGAVECAIAAGRPWDLELPFIRASGEHIWVRAVGNVELENGQVVRLVGAFQDVTAARRMRRELAEQHELLRVTLQSIGDAVITTDATGKVVWLNPAAGRMTGWSSPEAKGLPLQQVFRILSEYTRHPVENLVANCLEQVASVKSAPPTVLVSRQGTEFGIEDSASPIRNDSGDVLGVVLVFRDVTEQRRLAGEMSYRASHDTLTGLVNRTEFESRLQWVLEKARDQDTQNAMLYIDLDQFKLVNDSCGHAVGDELLQRVGKLLGESIRGHDTLARLGGDEFAILLENCPPGAAQRVAQQICESLMHFRFIHDGRSVRVGASIGLVPIDKRWTTTAAILQAADSACYAAKEAGRNRVHEWYDTDTIIVARQGEMQWAMRLEQALQGNSFVLHAQRIESLVGSPSGIYAEALLRLVEPDGTLVSPGAFLPAAERFHLASRIDRWVLEHALSFMHRLPDAHCVQLLFINLSGQSIGDRAFHRHAMEVLTRLESRMCERLCFEITETAAVTNMADATKFIQQIRALGVRVALDDFGAGASSFGYLKSLPVDFLKIDGQFIRNIVDDRLDQAAVRCFVEVAQVVGIKTIAEWVERPQVLQRLREIGLDYAQGFLIHRPGPIENLLSPQCAGMEPGRFRACGA
jgi:diguanylate cyclase (GGDEF)-like protein/PAS domain S-box-containing protein